MGTFRRARHVGKYYPERTILSRLLNEEPSITGET